MKITSVKTAASTGHCMHLWVKITTDAGITGIGECVHGGYQAIAIIKELEERLVGRDPFAIDAIFEETRRSLVFEGGFAGALITALVASGRNTPRLRSSGCSRATATAATTSTTRQCAGGTCRTCSWALAWARAATRLSNRA